jgi:hypothetical protein
VAFGQKRRLHSDLPDLAPGGYVSLVQSREIDHQFETARSKVFETKVCICGQPGAVRTLDDDGTDGSVLVMRER